MVNPPGWSSAHARPAIACRGTGRAPAASPRRASATRRQQRRPGRAQERPRPSTRAGPAGAGRDRGVGDLAHAHDAPDPLVRRAVGLHGVDRHGEAHGRPSGGVEMHVVEVPAGRRGLHQPIGERPLDRRHARRRGDDIAGRVEQRDAGDADTPDVGIHLGSEQRRGEARPIGDRVQQVPEIALACQRLRRRRAGGGANLGHVEFMQQIVGDAVERAVLPVYPVGHGLGAAVGNDAETGLPGAQVSVALGGGDVAQREQPGRDNRRDRQSRQRYPNPGPHAVRRPSRPPAHRPSGTALGAHG